MGKVKIWEIIFFYNKNLQKYPLYSNKISHREYHRPIEPALTETPRITNRVQSRNGRHQGYNKLIKVSLTYLKVHILITTNTSPTTEAQAKSNARRQYTVSQQSAPHQTMPLRKGTSNGSVITVIPRYCVIHKHYCILSPRE